MKKISIIMGIVFVFVIGFVVAVLIDNSIELILKMRQWQK